MPVINRHHATVHTTTVDVKIMRLDKKQVTLSVFRQIEEECIFTETGDLKGVPWGRVNYKWKDTPEETDYYLVWQKNGLLRRYAVPCRCDDENLYRWGFRGHPLCVDEDGPSYDEIDGWRKILCNSSFYSEELFNETVEIVGHWLRRYGEKTRSIAPYQLTKVLTRVLEEAHYRKEVEPRIAAMESQKSQFDQLDLLFIAI